jgi:hypothetical protein
MKTSPPILCVYIYTAHTYNLSLWSFLFVVFWIIVQKTMTEGSDQANGLED